MIDPVSIEKLEDIADVTSPSLVTLPCLHTKVQECSTGVLLGLLEELLEIILDVLDQLLIDIRSLHYSSIQNCKKNEANSKRSGRELTNRRD